MFAQDYALNLVQARALRCAGLLAAIVVHVVFYPMWRVLWGLAGR